MKTFNSGICVIATGEGGIVDDYYGILKDVIELVYLKELTKKCVLFSCDWFDTTINHEMRVHGEFSIVDVRRSRSIASMTHLYLLKQQHRSFMFLIQRTRGIKWIGGL